ncbi:MAG TPA: glutaredoxin family protein [Patescibacteria group bacterium]|nr:glutaredoxin family protein [Patescibacteria group bacterium]
MQIIIYSTTTCPYCKTLKDYLASKNIAFTEKLVDIDEVAQKEMSDISNGFLGVPFTSITKDDGTKEGIVGFDRGKIDTILGIAQ